MWSKDLEGTQDNFLVDAGPHPYFPQVAFQSRCSVNHPPNSKSLDLLNDLRVLSIYPWVSFNNPRDFSVFLVPDSYFLPRFVTVSLEAEEWLELPSCSLPSNQPCYGGIFIGHKLFYWLD